MIKKIILAFLVIGLITIALFPSVVSKVNRKVSTLIADYRRPKDLAVPLPSGGAKTDLKLPLPFSTKTPTPTISLPPAVKLNNVRHEYQGWNNCGPATTAMNLSFYKSSLTQKDTAPILKPDPDDKNVSPDEIVNYINNNTEYRAMYAMNGSIDLLKQLLATNIPVIVEFWFVVKPGDEMGHYQLAIGYDDNQKQFAMYDSYRGPNIVSSYDQFDENWKVFNRTFIVIYPKQDEKKIRELIPASYFDAEDMVNESLAKAQEEVQKDPNDKFALFNLGTSLSRLGNHKDAATAFDKARSLKLPWRMLWYQFDIFETYLALGRYDDVIALANANLQQAGNLEESLYYRGQAYEKTGKVEEAKRDYQQAVRYNKNYTKAAEALEKLQ